MWLSNAAVNNRVAVYVLMAIIIFLGWNAYISLPREAAPDITIPLVIISVPYIGVSPSDVEGLVTQPLERNLKSLKDIKQITSASKEGLSTIRVEFNTGIDIDDALRRVRDEVNSTRPELPDDILDPIVTEINISEFPIMYVNIGGEIGLARLKKIAENLQDKIEAIPGVLRADINGGLEPEVQVNCDIYRLSAYEISFDDVANAIRAENLSVPGGSIDTKEKNFTVRVPGEFKDVRPLEDIVVKVRQGKPIYLRDVATVDYSFEDRLTYSRLNGTEVVSLAVRKRAGENLIRIADQVKEIVKEEQANLPAGVKLAISNDQSRNIRRLVKELENSILTGMFLVVVTLFMFFGFKNSLLISTAIPFSMLIGFTILSAFNITLNFVVLFTLVLVLGILVDDAIVVIENIYRHQQEYHQTPIEAAKAATAEVALPVFTSTITTVSGFIPLLFWPGVVGDFMWYLPITLIITLGASLLVAFIISPVQGSKWIDYRKEIRKARENLEHPHWYKKYNPFTILYHKVDEKVFPFMQKQYVKTLQWTLQHRGKTIAAAVLFLFFVIFLFGVFNSGVEFFPNVEPSLVRAVVECPSGTSLEVTNGIAEILEDRLAQIPGKKDIEFVVATVGTSEDPFDFGGQGTPNKAQIAINFFEKLKRSQSSFITLEEIRRGSTGIAGADIRVAKQEMGPPVGAPVSVEISGEDYAQLAELSARIKEKIKTVPNLVDLKDDYDIGKPEVEVVVDREKAGLLWTNTRQIAGTVRAAINGVEASKYRVGEDEYKIRVRALENQRNTVADLENIHVTFMNMEGRRYSFPLTSVATIKRTSSVTDIRRKDMKRVITITGDAEGRLASEVLDDVKARLKNFDLPAGYQIKFTGKDEEQKKAEAFLKNAFVITLLLVFLILVSEFNSIRVPFVIMLSVLLSLIGVMIGLMVTRMPFSVIMTGVGIVALAGIVVRNGIILLDFAKQKLQQGMPLEQALVEAGRVRLRPVLLTAAATVLAVLPLATGIDFDWRELHFIIGAESAAFWGPLGVAIIFGLSIATFLTLVIVPTFYALLESWAQKIVAVARRVFAAKAEAEVAVEKSR
ncbi:MAG: efflux RND transporter permease subunit [candidate division KSB1 bacterium]|nr:efflux RND transporter permease subunit [candidate division KSB1 bacterium]MDZ7304240.1 efflux RND transporter permease subunit [candidate division KSB1 bacterium]MDZ7311715.1 efflux RND transporter permease subunit [candidate division KSB1 bacterium]